MDASQYLRRLKESCTQTLGRPKAIDAGLRTQIVRNAATTTYISPSQSKTQTMLMPTNECCLQGYNGAVTPIVPPAASCISKAACNDIENRYADPIILAGSPIPYKQSSTYIQSDSYKYQGTREQTAEAERLRNCRDCTRPPPPPTQGCLSFTKGILRTPIVNGFSISNTDAFTVEWFQKLTPRTDFTSSDEYYYTIFSIGNLNNETESMAFYYKVSPPTPISVYSVFASQGGLSPTFPFGNFGSGGPSDIRPISDLEDKWIHVALVGNGASPTNLIKLFVNGTQFGSAFNNYNFTISEQSYLTIGGQSPLNSQYYFNGCLTNFRFTKGDVLYTGPFTPPSEPLPMLPTTQLLLKTMSDAPANDSSKPQKPITPIGSIQFDADSPF